MPNEDITTKFKVDISELKKAMQTAKRQISIANSEFREAASTMDDWSKTTDGISAKIKQLNSNLKSQKTILSNLEKQYEAVVAEQGEGSAAADRLKVSINNQKATINKTEREISKYEESLKEVGEAEKKAAKTGKTVTEVLDDMGEETKDAGDGFTTLKGTIATFAGNMLTNLVGGIKNGISSIMNLAEETREYRSELAKLDTAFTTAGHSTKAAEQTYKDLYAVLGDEGQSVEAANHLAKLCNTEKELSDWTKIATGVYATFGDSLPIEGLTEAANETAKVGKVTGPLADALNWAGVSEDKFNESLEKCSSEQERQQLITETLNGLYTEAANKYEETNKSVMDANRANSDYTDTLATMGQKIEPVTTTLKEGFNGLLQELLKLVEDVDMEAFTAKIEEAFKVLKDEVLPAIKDGFKWIIDNKDGIGAALSAIAAGFVAFKGAATVVDVMNKVKTAGGIMQALGTSITAIGGPIGIVVIAISALVAAFIYLWNNCEGFRDFWINLWEKIKEAIGAAKEYISKAIDAIGKFFTETLPKAFKSVLDWIKKNWQSLLLMLVNPFAGLFKYFYDNNTKFKEFVDNAIRYIKELPGKVWTWLVNTINKINAWRQDMINKAKQTASNFVDNVINFFKQLPNKIWTWLVNVVSKISAWAGNMSAKGREAAIRFVNAVTNYIAELPGRIWSWLVNAASKVGAWAGSLASKGREAASSLLSAVVQKVSEIPGRLVSIGKDIVSGLWNGITNKVSWLKNKISGFVGDVTGWLKKFFKIGSPSKLMRDEVGKWLPEGIAVGIDKNSKSVLNAMKGLSVDTLGVARNGLSNTSTGGVTGGVVNNFTQVIHSPKQLSRLDIYRQSKNLLGYVGGR